MKLSVYIYVFELKKRYAVKCAEAGDCSSLRLSAPLLFNNGTAEDNRVFIPTGDVDASFAGSELLVLPKGCELKNSGNACSVIYTDAKDPMDLFNACQLISEAYNDWEKSLNDTLANGENVIQSMLNISANFLNNMLHIDDGRFCTAYYAESQSKDRYGERDYSVVSESVGVLSPDFDVVIAHGRKKGAEFYKSKKPFYFDVVPNFECICYPLTDGIIYGSLSMFQQNRKFDDCDYSRLQFVGEYLSRAISVVGFSSGSAERDGLKDIFSAILDSKHISKRDILRSYDMLGFKFDDRFVCLALRQAVASANNFPDYYLNLLENIISMTVISKRNDVFAVLINTSLCKRKKVDWLASIEKAARDFSLQVTVSDSFDNIQLSELYFGQAAGMLDLKRFCGDVGVWDYSELYTDFILERAQGNSLPEMMYTTAFRRLLEYDSNAEISYVDTLNILLEENLNYSNAAKRLFISRNAFMNRYERMKKILDVDLNDPEQRFSLELSLRYYKKSKSLGEKLN